MLMFDTIQFPDDHRGTHTDGDNLMGRRTGHYQPLPPARHIRRIVCRYGMDLKISTHAIFTKRLAAYDPYILLILNMNAQLFAKHS